MKKILCRLGICFFGAVFLFAAYQLIHIAVQYRTAQKSYAQVQQQYVLTPEPVTEPSKKDLPENSEPMETAEPEKPTAPIAIDFSALLAENEDIVGWLYCPDTPIHYPVVQGYDNAQYLRTSLTGQYLVGGTLFADYRNGALGTDRNYIIYGHNMKDDSMFGTLENYKKQSYYDAHPVLYFLTPEGDYTVELYAGLVIGQDSMLYSPEPNGEALASFLRSAKENSTFTSPVTLSETDNLLTLSTCAYEFSGARYVLICKLVPIG